MSRAASLRAGALVLALALAGCAHEAPAPEPAPPVPEVEAAPAPPPPPPEPDPDRLLGWRPGEVVALLGRPALVRWEGPAQIFLFEAADRSCALLATFREGEGAGLHLVGLAAHDPAHPAHEPVATRACLKTLLPRALWPRLASPVAGAPESGEEAGAPAAADTAGADTAAAAAADASPSTAAPR
ncbi:MAG: hypothetical protein KatS3mg119_1096 [Rhodothalassiaceae bacterium]|nr:MAG: hypothetical protein KatS3mg119_1096 [Rhodothalassiaceae bacterium]